MSNWKRTPKYVDCDILNARVIVVCLFVCKAYAVSSFANEQSAVFSIIPITPAHPRCTGKTRYVGVTGVCFIFQRSVVHWHSDFKGSVFECYLHRQFYLQKMHRPTLRSPSKAKDFSSICDQTSSEAHPASYQLVYRGKSEAGKWS
jgi:hypothetical protein